MTLETDIDRGFKYYLEPHNVDGKTMEKTTMGKIVTTITRINFTFDSDCGLAIYLDARIDGEKHGGASTYITDLFELNYIKQLLNKGKTGHAKETFDQEALDILVGKKAIFYMEDDNNTMHFKHIDIDYKGDES